MLKIHIVFVILAMVIFEVDSAQAKDRRSRMVPTKNRMKYVTDRRRKPKKFVYNMNTNQVTRVRAGVALPSQVTLKSSAVAKLNTDEKVGLRRKNQRSIASER